MKRVLSKEFWSFLVLIAILATISISAKNGCSMTPAKGAAIGTGVGAALGAGIGAFTGSPALGALIGAGAGALGGALVGDLMDDQGNTLTETEVREARVQALEMEGKYDSDLYVLRITRDANDNIKVVPEVKPKATKRLQFVN